jgi:protein phosphatase
VGAAAPRAADVRRAPAEGAAAPQPTASAPPHSVTPRRPQPPRSPAGPTAPAAAGARRRRRVPGAAIAGVLVLGLVMLGFWFASQAVYFVGVSPDGFVAVYRGLPYELPAGLDLYSENYRSGVPAAALEGRQRRAVTEHKLRSLDDANDLVRRLETGELAR